MYSRYKDACGRWVDPIGKNGNVIYLRVVNWRVAGVVRLGPSAPAVIRDPPPPPLAGPFAAKV
jgi:hypothetical protein